VLAAGYTAVVAPARVASLNPLGSTWVFVAVAALGLLALVSTPRPSWALRAGMAVTTGSAALLLAGIGRTLLVWSVAALLMAAWTTAGRRPVSFVPDAAPGAALPVVVASFMAVRLGSLLGANWQPLAALAAGGLVALVWSLLAPSSVTDRLDRLGGALDRFVTVAVGVPLAAVAWIVARLGALVARREVRAGWATPHPGQVCTRSRRSADRPRARLRPWTAPVLVLVAVVAAGWFGTRALVDNGTSDLVAAPGSTSDSTTTVPPTPPAVEAGDEAGGIEVRSAAAVGVLPPTGPVPAAYGGASWFPSFRRDMAWVMDERVAWRPMAVQRVLDVATPTVNVRDRVRESWTAPECDCRRVTVWLYGGSGAFGVGQRDEHTIASEFARAAAADGVVVDVQNRGIPGQMHWRNATRLAWDLTQSPPPDLVVFYEGAEEVASELELASRGLGNTLAPFEPFITDLYDEVMNVPEVPSPAPDGVSLDGWPTVDSTDREPGQLAALRYDRSRAMSRWTAEAGELPVRYFWQPSRFDRGADARLAPERAAVFRGAAKSLPTDVRDLAGTLSSTDRPVFYDDTNHNEFGAELVGAAMWADLRDQLTAITSEPS
jgi:hypothetical protein